MARLQNPLFGDSATGSIARAISFVRSPGFPSCRHKYHHKTTRTEGQDNRRLKFTAGKNIWKAFSAQEKEAWNIYATPPLNGYNTFLHFWLTDTQAPSIPIYLQLTIQSPLFFDLTPHIIDVTVPIILYEKEDSLMIPFPSPDLSLVPHIPTGVTYLQAPYVVSSVDIWPVSNTFYPTISISLSEV